MQASVRDGVCTPSHRFDVAACQPSRERRERLLSVGITSTTTLARSARPTDGVMSNYRRVYIPGGMYFFTVVTYRRQRFLIDGDIRAALHEGIQLTRQTRPFEIIAWVQLPDHLHCIWRLPPDDSDFSSRWSIIKRIVTQHCGGTPQSP